MNATTTEQSGLPPDILEHFYDLRALAMSASAMTLTIDDEGSDELNAIRRVLSCLADKALKFANEADVFLIGELRGRKMDNSNPSADYTPDEQAPVPCSRKQGGA